MGSRWGGRYERLGLPVRCQSREQCPWVDINKTGNTVGSLAYTCASTYSRLCASTCSHLCASTCSRLGVTMERKRKRRVERGRRGKVAKVIGVGERVTFSCVGVVV